MERRTVKIKIKVIPHKGQPLPDWGLGEGILAQTTVEVRALTRGTAHQLIAEEGAKMLRKTIDLVYEEV